MTLRAKAVVGVVGAALSCAVGVAGCGSSFETSDCYVSRTCPAAGGDGSASTDEAGGVGASSSESNTAGMNGADVTAGGAAGADATDTGGSDDGACHSASDCSNGDVSDGEEVCAPSGVCMPGNPPPKVLSVTPDKDAMSVGLDAAVVIEFDEPLDSTTVDAQSVKLTLGGEAIAGTVTYADSRVTFTPQEPLVLLGDYSVSIASSVTDIDGAALPEPFSSAFVTRDGAWTTVDAIKTSVASMAATLPMAADGTALLAWAGDADQGCPASAHPFLRGAAAASSKSFAVEVTDQCQGLVAAGNAAGVEAVAWTEPDSDAGSRAQQLRSGAWLQKQELISSASFQNSFGLAVGPDGVVSYFSSKPGDGSKAWHTDSTGAWQQAPTTLDALSSSSQASVAFNSEGNGIAVWRAVDTGNGFKPSVVASRYSTSLGSWTASTPMLGVETSPGAPAVAVDGSGGAMAIWVRNKQLVASRYTQQNGWESPVKLSGELTVDVLDDAPALVFDGTRFAAAWTASASGSRLTYTASYEPGQAWSSYEAQQQAAADGKSVARMPRLGTDGRGNLLLVWAKGASPTYTLVYQRYSHGAWSPITAVPGGTVSAKLFESDTRMPMAVVPNGLAALAWPNTNAAGDITGIRLASFY